jgi:hypothetical protein
MSDSPTPPRPPDVTPPVDDPTVPRQKEPPPQLPPKPDEEPTLHPHPKGRPEGVVCDPDA